ncbi:ATP-binding protein [Jiangella mangrovi]|uniref:Putative ATPase/DNA-binding CsgD family transcriptional regulator n=1 Tax=Jiangella mangrovi TaxID=1524084 RepID=A0A7W9GWS9_9ACTN|nr:LuxR C-terminal-related transcriptional regulator [Jiangella mangrovi]MBB5791479.1 putative ATPase/DNA-binding CsgD family transcriptional regulator [Jiangella mangrovi]
MAKRPVTTAISAREAEILTLVGEHRSNAEIAAELYISVRTVETHVSSLLRKLDAPDRRALAEFAAESAREERAGQALAGLPAPLNPFIGRAEERRALGAAVGAHRVVTAVGPGGVGKTRLALAVAADLAGDHADGVWFVDLVPVTDPAMVGAAVADALGVGEQQGRGIDDSVVAALADRRTLLVLDNCEHLPDGVAPFLERLLARCPGVSVLATSRARLMVPFERVYSVPPLSLDDASDAVALFTDRAAAVGWTVEPGQLDQVADVCRKLDGVALAVELAAARLPALGLDGLLAGLSDHLRLLVGGYRADDRHRSVRAVLDWSRALLDEPDLTLLRRVSVFVSPFTAAAAGTVAGFDPLEPDQVVDGLARLADQHLLSVAPSAGGTRYRALETIRQYGAEQLAEAGELDATRSRQLRWCLAAATELADDAAPGAGDWRVRFDAIADDLRAALGWAAERQDRRVDAHLLALALAGLAFTRNLLGESQLRYEQAAAHADDPAAAGGALRSAASVAACRMLGDDTYRLWRAAAEAALAGGDTAGAARDLAMAAVTSYRKAGTFAQRPPGDEPAGLLARAHELAGDDPAARAAVTLADCDALGYAFFADPGRPQPSAAELTGLAERAVELARGLGDPVAESAALQALTAARRRAGDTFAAAATAGRRVGLLDAVPVTPAAADELIDALLIATATSIGVGDLPAARRWGRRLRDLPPLAETGHVATSRLLMADALAGHATDVVAASGRFLDGWTRVGRPPARGFGPVAAAVAMIHALRGDDTARAEWLAVLDQLGVTLEDRAGYSPAFDAIALLHDGRADAALDLLEPADGEPAPWRTGILLHWHVALRAEAAVLAGRSDAGALVDSARPTVGDNPVAGAILDRAEALAADDHERLLATAAAFEAAGCPYQRARTLLLADGDAAAAGHAVLAELGLTPA